MGFSIQRQDALVKLFFYDRANEKVMEMMRPSFILMGLVLLKEDLTNLTCSRSLLHFQSAVKMLNSYLLLPL